MKKKPNEENSSVKQALLDLKDVGGNAEAIDILLKQVEQDKELLERADKLFQGHQYPEHSLNWIKLQGDVEFTRFLSPNAVTVLIAMCQNMNTDNLLQISRRDLIDITHITSLKAVQPAMSELVQNGCITEVIKASGRKSAVYMINPEISTIGKKKPHLTYLFWEKVRESLPEHEPSDNKDKTVNYITRNGKDYPKSPILDKWISLTKERTYSKGTEKWKDTSYFICYNKIKKLESKKASEIKKSLECNDRKESNSGSLEQPEHDSRIIQFNKTNRSARKRKAEPTACLEKDRSRTEIILEEGEDPLPF